MTDTPTFEHLAYAVDSIESYLERFLVPALRPRCVSRIVEDAQQGVRVAFVDLAGGARLELVEPIDDRSPVSRILARRRGGLYHVCYSVVNLDGELERFRGLGCIIVSAPTRAPAFDGRRIAFLLTPAPHDLIELVERASVTEGPP